MSAACAQQGELHVRPVFDARQALEERVQIPASVARLRLILDAEDMSRVSHEQALEDQGTIRVDRIPAGPDRRLTVEALEADGWVAYYASARVDILADQVNTARVQMLAAPRPAEDGPGLAIEPRNGALGDLHLNDHRVTLHLGCQGAAEVALANAESVEPRAWRPFTARVAWSLVHGEAAGEAPASGSADGDKAVSAVCRDSRGRASRTFTARAILDTLGPIDPQAVIDTSYPSRHLERRLVLGAVGADYLRVEGDVDAEVGLGWPPHPFATSLIVKLVDPAIDGKTLKALRVTFFDRARNATAPVVLDVPVSERPPSLGPEQLALITYERAPWGSADTSGQPAWRVTGQPGAIAPGFFVVAYNGVSPSQGRQLMGSAPALEDGAFVLDLEPVDRDRVFLAVRDAWGAESDAAPETEELDAVRVEHVEWVASTGDKRPGETAGNPHRFLAAPSLLPSLAQRSAHEPALTAQLVSPGVASVHTSGSAWLTSSATTEARPTLWASAYDLARGQLVVLTPDSETWLLEGLSWRQACNDPRTCVEPPSLHFAALVFDSWRGVTVLYGGRMRDSATDPMGEAFDEQTWEWDGQEWALRCGGASGCDPQPSGSNAFLLCFDEGRGVVVMHQGKGYMGPEQYEVHPETWEYDGESWRLRCHSQEGCFIPQAWAHDSRLLYDAGTATVRLYSRGNIYAWDGMAWTAVCEDSGDCYPPMTAAPAIVATDPPRERTVLVGDALVGDAEQRQTWEWDGTTWSLACVAELLCPTPEIPVGPPFFSPLLRSVVVPSGLEFETVATNWGMLFDLRQVDRLFTWDGQAWRFWLLSPGTLIDTPPSEWIAHFRGPTLVDDRLEDAFVILTEGGETWAVAMNQTARVCGGDTGCAGPGPRTGAALAYDSLRQRAVLHGGERDGEPLDQTWEWDGQTWSLICDGALGCAGPPVDRDHSLVFDQARGQTLLFGGGSSALHGQTWVWDGERWALVCDPPGCAGPSPRRGHGLAYDPARERVVLHGGLAFDLSDQTWEWDGQAWSLVCGQGTACEAPAPLVPEMVYDSGRCKVAMTDGADDPDALQGLWEWDGQSWWQACAEGQRCSHAVNGLQENPFSRDGRSRPGHLFEVDFTAALAPDASTCRREPETCPLERVSVSWHAAGVGQLEGADVTGVELLGWERGAWKVLTRVEGQGDPAGEPVELGWSTEDPAEMGHLILGPEQRMSFAVVPIGVNGGRKTYAEIASSHVEVRVRYRAGAAISSQMTR